MSAPDRTRPHRLYELLPRVHRMRDAERGWPLRGLLEAIGEQVDLLDENLMQLYENWFIETCEPWVIPYLGELLGVEPPAEAPGLTGARAAARTRVLAPRRAVARTLRHRRRKGTLAALEAAASDATRWPVRGAELCGRVGTTVAVRTRAAAGGRLLAPARAAECFVDLRDELSLARLGGAFDGLSHTVDVRSIESRLSRGLAHPLGLALFVWRLRAFSLTRAPARNVERVGLHTFSFHVLGQDAPLFVRPDPDRRDERGVPDLLRPEQLAADRDAYVGEGRSFEIRRDGPCGPAVAARDLVVADLGDWSAMPPPGRVFVDPERGRFAFSPGEEPAYGAWVSHHDGFAAAIGGGEYPRVVPLPAELRIAEPGAAVEPGEGEQPAALYRVSRHWHLCPPEERDADAPTPFPTLAAAVERWRAERPRQAIIEIADSDEYVETFALDPGPGQHLTLRAANGARPLIRLLDLRSPTADPLRIEGRSEGEGEGPAPSVVLDGLWIAGRFVRVSGTLEALVLRHTTLVPGWDLTEDCKATRPGEPSLRIDGRLERLTLCWSITGPIVIQPSGTEDVHVAVSDSVIDADDGEHPAIAQDVRHTSARACLEVQRSTIVGQVSVAAASLVQDAIFTGRLCVARRQDGCVRFSYLAPGSETPPRFRCQPEPADAPIHPSFESTDFGSPWYLRLAAATPEEIGRGAESGSEMGVYHDLFEPQRIDLLRRRLAEFTPARFESGHVFVT